ncbi:MAG: metal ABC transporter ATP-binding protein [bacterium]
MPKPSPKTSRPTAVSVTGCTVSFGGRPVVDDVTFSIPSGSVAAVVGPNGSGKTTLIRAILGLVPMSSGDVRIFGHPIADAHAMIGYVPQRLDFDRQFPITVAEFMELARHRHLERERIDEMIDEVGLSPAVLGQRLGSLSGGQLQRVLIAQAVLNDPDLLVLDEPSSGIDIIGEEAFYDIIRHLNRERDTTILMVSHELAVVSKLVDTVICLNHEMICIGPPKKTLTAKSISRIFGEQAQTFEHSVPGHPSEHDHAGHVHADHVRPARRRRAVAKKKRP